MKHPGHNRFPAVFVLLASLLASISAGNVSLADSSPNDLIATGEYQLAAQAILRLLGETHIPGQEDEQSAVLLSNLGLVYEKLGRYSEAESAPEKSARTFRGLGDSSGQNYARALNNLANVHLSQKRYPKAAEMFTDVLAMYKNNLPESAPDVALVLNNLGMTSLSLQKYAEAEQFFRESLDLHRKTKEVGFEMAVTLNNIALVCKLQNRLQEAAGLYSQAIEVWRNHALNPRPEVAVGLHNLASLENAMGANSNSENHFKEALGIIEASFPPEHPTRTAIMTGYADLLLKVGRKREAKQLLEAARTLRAKHEHQNFQDLTVSVRNLAR